jgi:hypothetical protein
MKEVNMAEFKHGSVSISLPGLSSLSEKAGNLSKDEVLRLAKAAPTIAQTCDEAADGIEVAGPSFVLPPGVTLDELRAAGARTRVLDRGIAELEYALVVLRQNRLLEVAASLQLVGQVNDQAQTQGKRNPRYIEIFWKVISFFKKTRAKKEIEPITEVPAPLKAA